MKEILMSRNRLNNVICLLSVFFVFFHSSACVNVRPVTSNFVHDAIQNDPKFWEFAYTQFGIEVRCKFCLTQDENLRFFDADLQSMGIIPIFIELKNKKNQSIMLNVQSVVIRNKRWILKTILLDEVRKAVFKKYHVKSYTEKDMEDFSNGFRQLMLHDGTLRVDETTSGVLFFTGGRFDRAMDDATVLILGNTMVDGWRKKLVFKLKPSSRSSQ